MATIDDKVVSISFESSKFESGVNKTINALNKLKEALHFPDAGKGFEQIGRAASSVKLDHIGRAVDSIKDKLHTLSVVGLAVLSNLAIQAVHSGLSMIKSLTIDPILSGYHEYETQIGAIQTILANTKQAGTGLKEVNSALNQLNKYADLTIYNFSEMTRNIGTFTAAGVDLKTSVASIKGIANLAAVSGSNADQASTAMYQLSQAIAAGSVKLQDWNSVVNAGMGGTFFQRALAQTAVHMGTMKESAVKLTGAMKNVTINGQAFRQSLSTPGKASWLTGKVLTTTLKQLSGDMTLAQFKAEGYTAAQAKALQSQAKMALQAATQVKTLSQLIDTVKEAIGSGWTQTWQLLFGDFGEAKTLFTGLSNAIGGFVSANAAARNKVLADWKALGGRTVLISALKQAFHDLAAVLKPFKQAFRDIFPATTGKQLYDLTVRFKAFTEQLKPSPTTIENLHRTFRGLFALLDIGKQIIGGIFTVFRQLFGAVAQGSGGFLNFTGNIGDFLVSVDQALKKGNRLHNFFVKMGAILAKPIELLGKLKDVLSNLFAGFSPGGFSGQMNGMAKALTPFQKVLIAIGDAWNKFLDGFSNAGQVMQPAVDAIVKLMQGFGPAISAALQSMNFQAILAVIRTGLLAGIFVMFKNFFGKGSLMDQVSKGFGKGILGNISGSFKALQGSMVAMQQNIKAKTLKEIAIAIALLTASVVALSFVDPKRLNAALTGMTVAFGQLLGAMFILTNISKTAGFIKLPIIAGALILLAGAIDVLSIAVIALSKLSWEQLAKGLGAVTILLLGLVTASIPLSANSAGMVRAGIGLTAMAVAIRILANAVAAFGGMNLSTLAKGLGSVAIGLGIMAAAMRAMPTGMVAQAAALVVIAVGLRILANVVSKFGAMDWQTIGKGMAAIGGALVVIGAAMRLMPTNMVITAAGLLLVSVALKGIAAAVESMGGMSVDQIAKGLIALAGALAILAAAMIVMEGSLAGAIALGIVGGALALLAPALVTLGKQSWTQIAKGLIALGAALAVIGVAAILLEPAIPAMLGLGAALVVIGAGIALAGAGIALIGIGLSAIAVAAPTAVGVILQAFVQFQRGIVENAKLLILGLLQVVKALANTAPQFVDALVKIVNSLLDGVIKAAPKIREAFDVLLTMALQVLTDNQGKVIQAGFNLLIALLQGISNNIGQVVQAVANIVINLLNALQRQLGRIQRAGIDVVVAFVRGIINNYAAVVKAGLDLIVRFVRAITGAYAKVISAGLGLITSIVKTIANNLGKVISAGVSIVTSFVKGIGNAGASIVTAAVTAIGKFINAMVRGALKLVDVGARAIVKFLNGVANAIDQYEPQIIAAGFRIGEAIVTGMVRGVASAAPNILKKAGDLVSSVKKKLEFWKSPPDAYGKWLGQEVVLGLATGLADTTQAVNAAGEASQTVIAKFNDVFQTASPSKVMYAIGRDVIAGFAQGLQKGTKDDINQAFSDLNQQFSQRMSDLRKSINDERQKIAELRKGKETAQENAEIKALTAALAEHRLELTKVISAQKLLGKGIDGNRAKLLTQAKQYADLTTKIEKITEIVNQFKDQYDALPQISLEDETGKTLTGAEQLDQYTASLTNQVGAVQQYNATLAQLRALGLDDDTYKMLLQQGTSGEQFAQQLLAGGKPAIDSINALDTQLDTAAGKLADNAAANLYKAGEEAATGLIAGLKSQQAELEKTMTDLANVMVKQIKKKLKIKSPSEIFAEIGSQSMEGMAKGLSDSSAVPDAIDAAAQDALAQMRKSMSDISSVITDQIDPNPTITPILDLTQIRSQAEELAALTNTVPITAAASYKQASAISAQAAAQASQVEQTDVAPGGASFKFEQNNYSPEALSSIEIYRQTKNQLSQIKSALALT